MGLLLAGLSRYMLVGLLSFVSAFLLLTYLLFKRGGASNGHQSSSSVLIVLGSGGHTAEMLKLLPALKSNRYSPRHYVAADTDTTSEKRAKARNELPQDAVIHRVSRSREVGQSYLSAVVPTAGALLQSFLLLLRLKPRLILCNGPGTCLPICLAAAILRFFGLLPDLKIVFVESVCRVKSLSMTGKLLYKSRIADRILVQWEELCER
jgi:beta-1,4-N-acetylglucosaminyltransferase